MKYETEENSNSINPNQTAIKAVQGRTDSSSGVKGYFNFDVVRQYDNVEIGRIKLFFDVPYDTIRYSRSTNFEINNYDDTTITIEKVVEWGTNGYSENKCKFIITYNTPKDLVDTSLYSLNCIFEIYNRSDEILLKSNKNYVKRGELIYENKEDQYIGSNEVLNKKVQGRFDSISGIEGYFDLDVLRHSDNVEIGQIKLTFKIPYDTNRDLRSTDFQINDYASNLKIQKKMNQYIIPNYHTYCNYLTENPQGNLSKKPRYYVKLACTNCRIKKERCSGEERCMNCKRHNRKCEYIKSTKKRGPKPKPVTTPAIANLLNPTI
ncbi:9754_t:CDS:2 [Scutellospora calospora]|uniref:9754_t:CDS:1 n=1 Tax=Scutellospora calospora TaxID=85575 RepID=A0ACA9LVI7_9GLOM|nr:9754_t:CDS:2 [Scutellospora calospora]